MPQVSHSSMCRDPARWHCYFETKIVFNIIIKWRISVKSIFNYPDGGTEYLRRQWLPPVQFNRRRLYSVWLFTNCRLQKKIFSDFNVVWRHSLLSSQTIVLWSDQKMRNLKQFSCHQTYGRVSRDVALYFFQCLLSIIHNGRINWLLQPLIIPINR